MPPLPKYCLWKWCVLCKWELSLQQMSLIFQGALKVLITKKNKILNKVFIFSTVTNTFRVKISERYYRLGVRL
jgi:hypothetical protein